MTIRLISQCSKSLDFGPRKGWPDVMPPIVWRDQLLCGFSRVDGEALDLSDKHFVDLWRACHPELALCEFSRFMVAFEREWPDLYIELREALAAIYGWRWSDRLNQTIRLLSASPRVFQEFADTKKMSLRDFSPLLALKDTYDILPFFEALPGMIISKFEAVRALELFVELHLMGRPINDILPASDNGSLYVRRLEKWRQPQASEHDEEWRKTVTNWPWPAQVQAEWQRFGDQGGIEIKIRTTSPDDFQKKLERLAEIPDTWSTKS
jgi:hypothetical protein